MMFESFLFGVGVVAATLFIATTSLYIITDDRRVGVLARALLALLLLDAAVAIAAHYIFTAF
jgi:hypothetical protein